MRNICLIILLLLCFPVCAQFGSPTRVQNHIATIQRVGTYTVTATDVRALTHLNNYVTPLWGSFIALYPFLGSVVGSQSVNMAKPGTYTFTATGSPTFSSTGCAMNGTSQYLDCGFTPSNSGTISDLSGYGVHRRDANNDLNSTFGIASTGNSYGIIRSDVNRQMYVSSNRADASSGTAAVANLWSAGWSSSTVLNAYKNGVNIKTNTGLTVLNAGNRSFYIGAGHGASAPIYGGANTVDFFWNRTGALTDANEALIYSGFNDYKTILGR